MITKQDFLAKGYELLKSKKGREEVKKLFLESFKKDNIEEALFFLPNLYRILFKPEKIFFDGYMYHRNPELEQQVRKEFIDFFFNKHIKEFLLLYPKVKEAKGLDLSYFLVMIIRHISIATPQIFYFNVVFLILIDILLTQDDESFTNLSLKGLARYNIDIKVFKEIISDEFLNLYKEEYVEKIEVYEEFKEFLLCKIDDLNKLKEKENLEKGDIDVLIFWFFNRSFNKKLKNYLFTYADIEKIFSEKEIKDRLKEFKSNFSLNFDMDKLVNNLKTKVFNT